MAPTPDRLLSERKVCQIVNRHRSTLYRQQRAGLFPRKLASGHYSEREIYQWIAEQKAARQEGQR